MGLAMVRGTRLRGPAARGPEAPRFYQVAPLSRGNLTDRDRTDGQQGQDQYFHRTARNRDRQEGRRNREAQGRRAEIDEDQGSLYQYPRGAASRPRSPTGGREYRAAARTAGCVPARDERGGDARDADGRAGREGAGFGPPGGSGNRAPRMVSRGARSAADAARRRCLRLRRGQDHLRRNRNQGMDLPRRNPHPPGRRGQALGRSRAAVTHAAVTNARTEESQVPQDAEGPRARTRIARARAGVRRLWPQGRGDRAY